MSRRVNQNKPNPPEELIEGPIRRYHAFGYGLPKILKLVQSDFNQDEFGLGLTTLKKLCKKWGLVGTIKQAHSFASISIPILELRKKFPKAGITQMRDLLRTNYGMRVPSQLIADYNNATDRAGVLARKARRLKRRIFHAAGVNHIWAMDQHDKWQRFGLRLHMGIEPFVGKIMWLVVWWTNSDPKFVARQYLNCGRKIGGIPLITQSDLGTENYNVAYAHTNIRHHLDRTLEGTLQHKWMGKHRNVKPEAAWWRLRFTWTPGFEAMLESGLAHQWYNPENIVDKLVFRWLAIPMLQRELDAYVFMHNTTRRRANRRKILPQGIPDIMFEKSHTVDASDFKIDVPEELFDEAEAKWAPPDNPVFQLVPSAFLEHVSSAYETMGRPAVTFDSLWDIFLQLRDLVEGNEMSDRIESELDAHTSFDRDREQPAFPNLGDFNVGHGGVANSESESSFLAELTDKEDDDDASGSDRALSVDFTGDRDDKLY